MPRDDSVLKGRLIKPNDMIAAGQNPADSLFDFVPPDTLKGLDEFVEESEYYQTYHQLDSVPLPVVQETSLKYPKHLDVFVFPSSDFRRFPNPMPNLLNLINYYCMDLASILPVVALGIQPGDDVLDMCAGTYFICSRVPILILNNFPL